jgi:MFS transporter, FHS family, L-fucose permease
MQTPSQTRKSDYFLPFVLITSLFFLWGFAHNLNPILIPHLKKACQLSDFQSAMIDSAFFVAYFLMAIPAGMVMKKYGFKAGILMGLFLFALGAFLFIPAANVRVFGFFLTALFVIASGLTFLETAANPYITVLGDPANAAQRLNIAQSFNGLAASLAAWAGGKFILTGESRSEAEIASMSPEALSAILDGEAASVKIPYLIIGLVVLAIAFLLYRSRLPEVGDENNHSLDFSSGLRQIFRHRHFSWGLTAQFFYVGAQVCVSSFFIRYLGKTVGMDEKSAAEYLAIALFAFMAGRFIGSFLMRFLPPARLLGLYAAACVVLMSLVVLLGGQVSVYSLIGTEFFMSIMFPTIFSLSLQSLGSETKLGSSLLVMSIVGGALLPLIMGYYSDKSSIQQAYFIPLLCFAVVFVFAAFGSRPRNPVVIRNESHSGQDH